MNLILAFLLAHTLVTDYSAEHTVRIYTPVQDTTYVVNLRDSVVDYAKTFLGKPYKYACASPSTGFDCSGFTWFVFNHFKVMVPRSSKDYATLGTRVTLETCRKGDIMLFTGTNPKERRVGHVGIVISDAGEPVQFIHASSSAKHSGVVITDYASSHYPERFIGVCSVLP